MKKTSTLARFLLFDMSLYKFLDVIGEQQAPVVFDLNHIPIPPLDGKQLPDLLGWMTCIPTGILEDRIKRIGGHPIHTMLTTKHDVGTIGNRTELPNLQP